MKHRQDRRVMEESDDGTPVPIRSLTPSMFGFSGPGSNRRLGPIVLLPTLLRDLRGEVFPASSARGMFGRVPGRSLIERSENPIKRPHAPKNGSTDESGD
jgi:hypothetical protein